MFDEPLRNAGYNVGLLGRLDMGGKYVHIWNTHIHANKIKKSNKI